MRVYELSNELNTTAKDLIEKVQGSLSIVLKSHSSTLTPNQITQIRNLYMPERPKTKPKAFVVKKVKPPVSEEKQEQDEVEQVKEEVKIEPPRAKSRLEIVRPAPKSQPVKEEPKRIESRPRVEKVNQERPQRPQIRPQDSQNRPGQNYQRQERSPMPQRPEGQNRRPMASQNGAPQGPYNTAARPTGPQRPSGGAPQRPGMPPRPSAPGAPKAPIKRHIIPQEMYDNRSGNRGKKKKERTVVSKEEIQERISLEKATQQKHKKRSKEQEQEVITKVILDKPLTISELADKTAKTPAEIIKFLMMQGIMATVNAIIDVETAKKVCTEFELEVLEEDLEAFMEEELVKEEKLKKFSQTDAKLLKNRAPVVTIMGHVDHGKTTLLDSIRASKHKIVSTEVGGITQSIGAYTVWQGKKKIVFIDTPGHEAFTQMRARGAKSTDIAVLVVAADDGVMPQTIEAINHAKSAEVPIIVAVNKIDKPGADPDRILQQLTEYGLVAEAWGGDTITVKVSALQGTGIDELLEYILLVAEVQNLKAVDSAPATGVVIEANLDKGKGPVATMLVQNGTLKVGDCVCVGSVSGKVRALLSDSGQRVRTAGPSTPVEILGLTQVPQAGDQFEVLGNEKSMRSTAQNRKDNERQNKLEAMRAANIEKGLLGKDEITVLNLIIKANTHGSAEAVSAAIQNVESKQIIPKILHVGVGNISEADVMLAATSGAIIMGFSVKEDLNAQQSAEKEGVQVRKYDIIYQVLEDVEKTMLSLLDPEIKEVELGKAEVRQVFTVGKTTKIAGCYVLEGKIIRGKTAVLMRDGKEIFRGQIDQLKRFKDDVKEVATGFECGLSFAKFNDIQEGDIVEVSTTKEVERVTLV